MVKSLRSSKRSARVGLLTNTQRTKIKNKKLTKNDKWKLTSLKSGDLTKGLKAMIDDLGLALKNDDFDSWFKNYKIIQEFRRLEGKIDQILRFYVMPLRRLAVKTEGGKRWYYLKRIEHEKATDSEIKTESYRREQMTIGLKSYEKNLVLKYIENVGYNLPLEEENYYTWDEVKKLLLETMNQKPPPLTDEDKEILNKRREMAWKMIDKKIDPRDRNKIIVKTGFGIGLVPYSHFRPDKK